MVGFREVEFMKRLVIGLMSAVVVASFGCEAQAVCARVAVRATYETATANLTLADLLSPDCLTLHGQTWREAAALVNLGAAPRIGSVRVLEGSQIRRLLEKVAGEDQNLERMVVEVPERVVVRRSQAVKSCAEIGEFLAPRAPVRAITGDPGDGEEKLECTAVRGVPAASQLELSKTTWNSALQRWEFALRCVHPEQCVPFLVWTRAQARLSANSVVRGAASGEPGLRTVFHSRRVQHYSG